MEQALQRIRLDIAYDGTNYLGWQRLGPGKQTVQSTLEEVLQRLLGHSVFLMGSGRTDSGVHARHQVAHFETSKSLERYHLVNAINSLTPTDIKIKAAYECPKEFHALASVERKIYKYYILNRPYPSAFEHRYSWLVKKPLDIKKLNSLTEPLIGKHDFASFRTQGSNVKTTVRQIFNARWELKRPDLLVFTVMGSGFLKQMVRNIVGTVVHYQLKNRGSDEISRILAACDRRQAGPTAPPQGLFLHAVRYPSELDNKCRKL